jgi:SAM-dependent methyltransferase
MFLRDRLGCDVLSLDVVDANKTDVPFRLFDGRTLPVGSGGFDVILLLYVLHHATDDAVLLREAKRVLADQGRVIVAEDCVDGLRNRARTVSFHVWLWVVTRMTWHQFRTTEAWVKRFREIGFDVSTQVDLGPHLGRRFWPRNTLFVLTKSECRQPMV